MCALARSPRVGVDVEFIARPVPFEDIADGNFAPSELAILATLEGPHRLRRYFELWTLKEAYLTAHGVGMAFPLDRVAFMIGQFGPRLSRSPACLGKLDGWWFTLLEFDPAHLAAVARQGPVGTIVTQRWQPDASGEIGLPLDGVTRPRLPTTLSHAS